MHLEGFLAPVLPGRRALRDGPHPVVEQRPIDEVRPDVEDVDQLRREPVEAPRLVGVHGLLPVARFEARVEVDDALHEGGREGPDAAVIEQVDPLRRSGLRSRAILRDDRVVAEVGVAVDHAIVGERIPPGLEHRLRDGVAVFERRGLVVRQLAPLAPSHGEEALRRQSRHHLGHPDQGLVPEDRAVQRRMSGLEFVVELFPQPRRDLGRDLAGIDGGVHAGV